MSSFKPAAGVNMRPVLVMAGSLFVALVILVAVSGYAEEAGYQIPTDDLQSDYLIGGAWAIALGLLIAAWPVAAEDKEPLLLAWLAKCYVTLLLMLPYEKRYDLDCFSYFYSMRWPEYGFDWNERVRSRLVVVGIGWYQEQIADSYHAVKVTFAMIGLIALYLIYRSAMVVVGKKHSRAFLLFALFPSILFWSSIIGKDPVVFLGVALYAFGVTKWRETRRPQFLLVLACGITIATIMRVWLGLILGIPLLYFMIRGVRGFLPRLATTAFSVVLVMLLSRQFASGMAIDSPDDLVTTTDRIAHQFSGSPTGASGSTREIEGEFTSYSTMLAFAPIGIFTVLFRPLPGEVRNVFGTLSGLENIVIIFFTIVSVRYVVVSSRLRKIFLREPLIVWALLLVLTWSTMYGFISYQNLGASVRFRLPIIAVYVGLLLCIQWLHRELLKPSPSPRRTAVPASPPRPLTAAPPLPS